MKVQRLEGLKKQRLNNSCPKRVSAKWKLGLENGTSVVTFEEKNYLMSPVPDPSTFTRMAPPWAGRMLSPPCPFL